MIDNKSLFLLIPNNSGSSFTYKSIRRCVNVTSMLGEGQFADGFEGVRPSDYDKHFIWGATELKNALSSDRHHDWEAIKKAWHKSLNNYSEDKLFVEKSPPNIARLKMLQTEFPDSKFIISIRNPYAVFESIWRARSRSPVGRETIIRHIIHTMELQKKNMESLSKNQYVYYRYEDMCQNPDIIANKIKTLYPDHLQDLTFNEVVKVKGRYENKAHNYNDEQISRLDDATIDKISLMLYKRQSLMKFYGYNII